MFTVPCTAVVAVRRPVDRARPYFIRQPKNGRFRSRKSYIQFDVRIAHVLASSACTCGASALSYSFEETDDGGELV